MIVKMIDILEMITNGEQPKHIRFKDEDWYWGYDTYTYYSFLKDTPDNQPSLFTKYRIDYCLHQEVEIIEDCKISKLVPCTELEFDDDKRFIYYNENFKNIINKINEIIDFIECECE